MIIDFPVEQTVKARSSVRTYAENSLSETERNTLKSYFPSSANPFGIDVKFRLLEKDLSNSGAKLGTYGVIKGADSFIGASVKNGELALEALGYSFEKLILYATSLGLGTCWLGGTFNRSGFAKAMELTRGELFPAVSPVGHPLGKMRFVEALARRSAKSGQRKSWNELFFDGDLSVPLTKEKAGQFAFPLEMLRLAPSAVNRQPWRIIFDNGSFHFYEAGVMRNIKSELDIQRVDIGIAACHFHLASLEKGLSGEFKKLSKHEIGDNVNMKYVFSWVSA